jgi:catechol 2,3-dioxygenase-like lactoylglutathione lyase family enzyme
VHSRLLAVTFDVQEPARAARFWAGMLGREVIEDGNGLLLAGTDTQLGLRFMPSHTRKTGPNPMHPHLTSTTEADRQDTVAKALRLGAGHLDVGQRPAEGHIVLADPEGNEFCVIEPGNAYLAGCGPLGEVACDGGRAVGLFWSEALGWPLVWDQDDETAIQSPQGGTKIGWGGPSAARDETRNRQRFHLGTTGVDHLISLGATRLETDAGASVVLADPGGNEFSVAGIDDPPGR